MLEETQTKVKTNVNRRKKFAQYVADKKLISKIHEAFPNLNEKANNSFKNKESTGSEQCHKH